MHLKDVIDISMGVLGLLGLLLLATGSIMLIWIGALGIKVCLSGAILLLFSMLYIGLAMDEEDTKE